MPDLPVLSVSELTYHIKEILEVTFPTVCVRGEISNCTRAGSGHVYLTLKDDSAQIRGILWRNTAQRLKFQIEDGLEVIATGGLEVYEARGAYQIIIREMWPQGLGPLELAFRQLCEKLTKEGLFDSARKRPLPRFPRRIALITSPSGAAVRDLVQVITRRWPAVGIVLMPVAVQGDGAAEQIAEALRNVHRLPDVDVVITGRGGGSLEDLWAFNEEIVARAIVDCPIPVISAVGHEIDVSISDLVADRRALTPSEAGELVVPNREEILADLRQTQTRISTSLRTRADTARRSLDQLSQRRLFVRPWDIVIDRTHWVDELHARLKRESSRMIERSKERLAGLATALQTLSPLNTLARGYSLTTTSPDNKLLRSSSGLQPGQLIETKLAEGRILSRIEQTFDSQSETKT